MSQNYPPPQWQGQPAQPQQPNTSYPPQDGYWMPQQPPPYYMYPGTYYQLPSPPLSPQSRSYRSFWVTIIFITCFLIVGTAIAATSHLPTGPTNWATTHTYTGNGTQNTETFTVGDHWKLSWSCDPSSFAAAQYNVIVYVYESDNTPQSGAINTICSANNTSGSTEEYQGGTIYLSINSEAAWTIEVQEPQ